VYVPAKKLIKSGFVKSYYKKNIVDADTRAASIVLLYFVGRHFEKKDIYFSYVEIARFLKLGVTKIAHAVELLEKHKILDVFLSSTVQHKPYVTKLTTHKIKESTDIRLSTWAYSTGLWRTLSTNARSIYLGMLVESEEGRFSSYTDLDYYEYKTEQRINKQEAIFTRKKKEEYASLLKNINAKIERYMLDNDIYYDRYFDEEYIDDYDPDDGEDYEENKKHKDVLVGLYKDRKLNETYFNVYKTRLKELYSKRHVDENNDLDFRFLHGIGIKKKKEEFPHGHLPYNKYLKGSIDMLRKALRELEEGGLICLYNGKDGKRIILPNNPLR
jgi:hypothetical protein